jgi:hypothetical protein
MNRLHRRQSILLVLTALFYLPSYAIAVGPPTVLIFDDVTIIGNGVFPMPPGYGGLSWPNNMGLWSFAQSPYNPQSPPNRVLFNYNNESGVSESLVTFVGGPKIFEGAYFAGFNNAQFKLYSGATLVSTSGTLFVTSTPTFLASGYAGPVDKVGIIVNRGTTAMDNFTFQQVPEPSTLFLLVIGAINLLGYRKSKSHGSG